MAKRFGIDLTSVYTRWPLAVYAGLLFSGIGILTWYYLTYAHEIDAKLRNGVFGNMAILYAAPPSLFLGQESQVETIASHLRRTGYSEGKGSRVGWYRTSPDLLEIHPGPDSYGQDEATISLQGGHIVQIRSLRDGSTRGQYALEPEAITNVFDHNREKLLIVPFGQIPDAMVKAVLAAEDKRFFQHHGFDPVRILRASWVDIREQRNSQGASTLTQQLARTVWLGPRRGWRRKIPEILMTVHLERTLTKKQIFEDYANTIYLGNVGSFSIHGFGKASQIYLGKDLGQVTLPEAAFLAVLIQAPSSRNPLRYPERAKARRDMILRAMLADRFIREKEYKDATEAQLRVVQEETDTSDAPYFVDVVNETLHHRFPEYDFQNHAFRVYTTLDTDLQRDAVEAVRTGVQETDRQWKRRSAKYGTAERPPAQVALVALDAQTGEVKALIGGRSYRAGQLNHALSKRQPGSSFKPFVYAAAFGAALTEGGPVLTPASTVDDEPTTFYFNGKPYAPADDNSEYSGEVTLRFALAHSLNVPAVRVAEIAGYDRVARVARAAGLGANIKPTPSVALGAYEVTPLEMSSAYSIFVDSGHLVKTSFITGIRDPESRPVFESHPQRQFVIDPRIAYLVVNMMQEVLNSGTGASVRSRGFTLPAAGKTGTSRDGWFAGFTSRLICVVWVGFDDNTDIKLTGARSALPIWAEFMKRAHQHAQYSGARDFVPPRGLITAEIDSDTGELASPACPKVRSEVFVAGTEPIIMCRTHSSP